MGTMTDSDHESGDLESLVYGPLNEQDSIIQDIMSRREGDEFPEVLPEQASSDSIEKNWVFPAKLGTSGFPLGEHVFFFAPAPGAVDAAASSDFRRRSSALSGWLARILAR